MFTQTLRRHLEAIAAHDIDGFTETVAPDVRLVGTDGTVLEGSAAFEAHRAWFADRSWQFHSDIAFTHETAGAGWALARIHYDTGESVSEFWLFLLFAPDDSGAWRLTYDQGTSIKR